MNGGGQTQKRTYTCFVCQKAGLEVQVILDGKDDQGRTKYLEPDGTTKHYHKSTKVQPQAQVQPQQQQQLLGQATYDVASDVRQIKESIKEILELVRTVRQSLKQNQQMADAELVYDKEKEDGLV